MSSVSQEQQDNNNSIIDNNNNTTKKDKEVKDLKNVVKFVTSKGLCEHCINNLRMFLSEKSENNNGGFTN